MYPDPKIYVLREVISEKEMARLRELAAPIVSIPTCKCMGVGNFFIVGGGLVLPRPILWPLSLLDYHRGSNELMKVPRPFWQNESIPKAYWATATPLEWKWLCHLLGLLVCLLRQWDGYSLGLGLVVAYKIDCTLHADNKIIIVHSSDVITMICMTMRVFWNLGMALGPIGCYSSTDMCNDHLTYFFFMWRPLTYSMQLKRATARNWRTGKFEHATYRISKRYNNSTQQ